MDQDQAPPRHVPIRGERRLTLRPAPDERRELETEEHVGYLLRLAYQRASSNLTAAIGSHGITPMQFQTLLRLRQHVQLTQNELGRSVGMPPANIHATVRRLLAGKLVATEASPTDKRLTLVRLTPKGKRTLEQVLPAADAANAFTLSPLAPDEQRTLIALLGRLGEG
jgi:MarR family transcriptional regulator, lower aerobic nicotinate degradation pathway regulator